MLELFLGFLVGFVCCALFSYVMALGHSINLLKLTQRQCAALFLVSEQGLQEILFLKYLAMEESGRSEQNVTAQKYIDQMSIGSVKKTIMRNFVNEYPESYKHALEYTNWEEMEKYVNETLKSEGMV